jgi:hypothetical protein
MKNIFFMIFSLIFAVSISAMDVGPFHESETKTTINAPALNNVIIASLEVSYHKDLNCEKQNTISFKLLDKQLENANHVNTALTTAEVFNDTGQIQCLPQIDNYNNLIKPNLLYRCKSLTLKHPYKINCT